MSENRANKVLAVDKVNLKKGNFEVEINDVKKKIKVSSIVHIVCNLDTNPDNNIGGDLTITTEEISMEKGLHNEFYDMSFNDAAFITAKKLVKKAKKNGAIIQKTHLEHDVYTLAHLRS